MKARKKATSISTKPVAKKTASQKISAAKPTTQTAEKQAVAFSLHGWGVEIECAPVDEKAFKRLTVDGVSSWTEGNEFDKYLRGADTRRGGLNGHCSLKLGDEVLRRIIRLRPKGVNTRLGGNAKYLLVNLSSIEGDIRCIDIDGDFEKKQLTLDLERYELSDGTSFDLVWFDYGSTETYDCGVSCKSSESFVLTCGGKRHPVIFNDE